MVPDGFDAAIPPDGAGGPYWLDHRIPRRGRSGTIDQGSAPPLWSDVAARDTTGKLVPPAPNPTLEIC
jgi:hypothetical protein